MVFVPGPYTLRSQDLVEGEVGELVRRWMGAEAFGRLTIRDLEDLARHLDFAAAELMLRIAEAAGEQQLPAAAPPAFWHRIMGQVQDEDLLTGWHRMTSMWLEARQHRAAPANSPAIADSKS